MLRENYQHLNRLSMINNNTGVKFLNYAATPGSHCPMHTALATISRIQGVSSLVIGTAECGYYSRYVMKSPYGSQGELHYIYELDSNEVVFGCREGVKQALLQMAKEGARVIVMIITCIPALIGEDPQSIIEEVKTMTDTKIAFVDLAHFKRNGYQSGYTLVLEQLINLLDPKEAIMNCSMEESKEHSKDELLEESIEDSKHELVKEFQNNQKPGINLFGEASGVEIEILKEQLRSKGFYIHTYDSSTSMKDLSHMVKAKLTIILSSQFHQAAKCLETKHGVPYVSLYSAFHKEEIRRNYEWIETLLSITFQDTLFQKESQVEQLFKEGKEKYHDIPFISTNAEFELLPLTEYLCLLKMKPVLLHVEEYHALSMEWKERILSTNNDPYVTYLSRKDNIINTLENSKNLVSIGTCKGMEQKKIIDDNELRNIMMQVGFERSVSLLKKLNEVTNTIAGGKEQIDGTL